MTHDEMKKLWKEVPLSIRKKIIRRQNDERRGDWIRKAVRRSGREWAFPDDLDSLRPTAADRALNYNIPNYKK